MTSHTLSQLERSGCVSVKGVLRVAVRDYLSNGHLWAAAHFASASGRLEDEHRLADLDATTERAFNQHRGYVIGSILASASFLEALINEFFSDAMEHSPKLSDLDFKARLFMASIWSIEHFQRRAETLEKFQVALKLAGKPEFSKGDHPYQNAKLLMQLRNAIVHFKPETGAAELDDPPHPSTTHRSLTRALKGRFAPNQMVRLADSANAFFPKKCLGHGCAEWCVLSSHKLALEFYVRMGLQPWFPNELAALMRD